jgi:Pyruvate/2-oxoacid:ferredoxin oxidoreductase delta subunit
MNRRDLLKTGFVAAIGITATTKTAEAIVSPNALIVKEDNIKKMSMLLDKANQYYSSIGSNIYLCWTFCPSLTTATDNHSYFNVWGKYTLDKACLTTRFVFTGQPFNWEKYATQETLDKIADYIKNEQSPYFSYEYYHNHR